MSATENNINGRRVVETEAFDIAELFVRNNAPQTHDSESVLQNTAANSPTASEEHLGIAPLLTRSLLESKWANTPENAAAPTSTPTPKASPLWIEGTYTDANGKTVKDGDPVSFNDVAQGGYGDCYFMASLAAIARSHPETIRNMITENHDAQGKTTSYTVTFHEKDRGWFGTGLFASGGYNDLYNPWGSSHPKPIPFSELSKYFTDVAVG